MDKAVVTILLLIGAIVCVAFMINALFPAVNRGSDAVTSLADVVHDRITSRIAVINAVSEYDGSADNWNDTNGNGWFDIIAWVKNVGDTRVGSIEECDVFFGPLGDYQRYSHETYASGTPNWAYELKGGATDWGPGVTNQVTLRYAATYVASGLSSGTTHRVKMVLPNGISDEFKFSW